MNEVYAIQMLGRLSDDAMLEHNRRRSARLLLRKRWLVAVTIMVGVPLLVLSPPDLTKLLWIGLLSVFLVLAGAIEIQRLLIFKRDLRERRRLH